MKLRRKEICPIHRSLFCCGREQVRKQRKSWAPRNVAIPCEPIWADMEQYRALLIHQESSARVQF
jgi:hypothetical protein